MPSSTSSSDAVTYGRGLRRAALRALLFGLLLLMADRLAAGALEWGLRRYHGLDRPARVLCVGHSRTILGLDPVQLADELGQTVARYAVNGATLRDRFAMLRHYLALHPGVTDVLYDVDAFTFRDGALSSNSYRLFEPFAGDPVMGDYVRELQDGPRDRLPGALLHTTRFEEVTLALALRGLVGAGQNLKVGALDIERLERRIATGQFRRPGFEPGAVDAFEEMVDWVRGHGVRLWLIDMPAVARVNDYHADTQRTVREVFTRLAAADEGVRYIDLHRTGESRYELFYDGIHLNAGGREFLTGLVGKAMARP